MDGRRFDALTMGLATARSRRQVLRGLVGGLVVVLPAARGATRAGAQNADRGNDACARFCNAVFPAGGERGRCTRAAARGEGLCFACGPRAADPTREVCGTVCCAAGEVCCGGQCVAALCDPGQSFDAETCACRREAGICTPDDLAGPCRTDADCPCGFCGGLGDDGEGTCTCGFGGPPSTFRCQDDFQCCSGSCGADERCECGPNGSVCQGHDEACCSGQCGGAVCV